VDGANYQAVLDGYSGGTVLHWATSHAVEVVQWGHYRCDTGGTQENFRNFPGIVTSGASFTGEAGDALVGALTLNMAAERRLC
jgi:hypothetical protein